MKFPPLAISVLALALTACGAPDDTKAQDSVFEPAAERAVPRDAAEVKASFAPVVRSTAPAVVNISARGVQTYRDPYWGQFRQQPTGSVGSGVIVRADGIVVTNTHVIQGMDEIIVGLNDRRQFTAKVLLADERSDIAVLQLEGVEEPLPVLRIDAGEDQQIGDLVLAIGNPFGVGQTVTNGIISALNRTETGISDSGSFIQTDAAINPGNSGGALVDMDGDLIGINTAIFSRSGSSSGVGFAVPATMVQRVVDAALDGETTVVRPWLGVKGEPLTAEEATRMGLDRPRGLKVTDLFANGPAARAGIRQGDVILAVGNNEINDQGGLNFRVGTRAPGDTVAVTLIRDGREQQVNARVQPLPGEINLEAAVVIREGAMAGAQVLALNPAIADRLLGDPFAEGVIVGGLAQNSIAARQGFRRGDIIVSVNGQAVDTARDLAQLRRGAQVVIQRGGQSLNGTMR
ncbi:MULTISPECIES: trypsin-like peptidase domain-containing protein [unclassified Brevundimonas]|jgi:Do/DeqQ family serine protease|uniref:trypsin-like peptidase domain-containing protein n=1 Tax=unclassified Brevundimonas TaxID=2622653 RepID=UPI000C607905|nr:MULTISPECIES: trypsin-like peptidase domain-containing protein [unclassified Brevundimonas]MAL87988.1 serine protease [Brevundimonas sp.]